jgi:dTDP-4-amino-4,6-dideoxygalactose transaminase
MEIPLTDLAAQHRSLKAELLQAIDGVLETAQFTFGPNAAAFENEFGTYCGTRYAVGVGNGTDALYLALRAASIGPGDEVITVSHTFIAVVEALALLGARPVFVDVDPRTHTMDVALVEAAVTQRTKAIVPVHLYGSMVDMDALLAIAARRDLVIVEDAAQAHGAESRGRRAGTLGQLGCFSFYCAKNLGACGEAGAVVTSDPELDRRLRLYRSHGETVKYHHDLLAINSRLDEIQAAVLRVKLRRLDDWNALRRQHACLYDRLLADTSVERPGLPQDKSHVFHQYVVRSRRRDDLRQHLAARGIATGVHYPLPVHLQPAAAHLGYSAGDFPVTEQLADEIVSLPMFPELTDEQIAYIADAIAHF